MRILKNISILGGFIALFISCQTPEIQKNLADVPIIPLPLEITAGGYSFILDDDTRIGTGEALTLEKTGNLLSAITNKLTGFSPSVGKEGNIQLTLIEDRSLGKEGYILEITKQMIEVRAFGPAGIFYGIQTLAQLLPTSNPSGNPITIASGTIRDIPEYEYRGAMLDVSRHFFPVEDVMRFIDFLAVYKMNALHLHLSDDQGWRIEIKSWPDLAVKGGSTEVGGSIGGYYTQDDYKAIVKYAADRFIIIVPEIDMPGHTNAALVSYPELNCDGKAPELYTGTEVGFSSFCTDKEITYQFIDDVVRELSEITPGPYLHIGGDESHATKKDDYIFFVSKVQQIVDKYGKNMVGWDEIAQANISEGTIIQHWASTEFATQAVKKGNRLIMSPASRTYLDMKYDSTTSLGLSWAGYIEVDHGYNWDPATFIAGVSKENILGIEAPLWSETVTNMDEIEFMTFPRLPGYAELGWSGNRTVWDEYKQRLSQHAARIAAMDIQYYKSPKVPW